MATKKIRVYELARELGVENSIVLELAADLKLGVKSPSSSIDDPLADRVRRAADERGLRKVVEPDPVPEAPAPEAVAPEPPVPAAPAPVAPAPAPSPPPEAREPESPSPVSAEPAATIDVEATPRPADPPAVPPRRVVSTCGSTSC